MGSPFHIIKKKLKKHLKKIRKFVKRIVIVFYKIETKLVPVQKDIIIFESNLGINYTGNPRCIYEEMVRRGLDKKYRCYFVLNDTSTEIPGTAIKIRRTRTKYFFVMGISGVLVSDTRQPKYIIKRKGATYIQTWHGTPLKKLALDMESLNMGGQTDLEKYKSNFVHDTRAWDYLISQNSYSTEIFKRAFAFDKTMLEIGYPRNDILFRSNNAEAIQKLKDKMGLPTNKKILLYAPTWRDNEYYEKGAYKFNRAMDFDLLREKLGDEYVCIVKYHYLVKENLDWSAFEGFVYKFDMCEDIAELYLVADMLITDYSSVMFDYSVLKRPMFFFAYDLEEYKDNLRGFYFDFMEEAPGPITKTTKELIDSIVNYNAPDFKEKYDAFHCKFNHLDDGHASEKIVQLIEKIVNL
ncbi:MAG: tagF [Lachnospiraceae bacterium]|jgi:CDP-glycerol glycerophosphotransferase|nr:tagF [Lachnospiraceae bacterium]